MVYLHSNKPEVLAKARNRSCRRVTKQRPLLSMTHQPRPPSLEAVQGRSPTPPGEAPACGGRHCRTMPTPDRATVWDRFRVWGFRRYISCWNTGLWKLLALGFDVFRWKGRVPSKHRKDTVMGEVPGQFLEFFGSEKLSNKIR